jgi:hypothetical protein
MNLSRYTVDVCFTGPILVFRAKAALSLAELLRTLKVSKGEGGGVITLAQMSRSGAYSVPSHLLFVVEQDDTIKVVGAIDEHFDRNHEFAVCGSASDVLDIARGIARELYTVDSDTYERVVAVMA